MILVLDRFLSTPQATFGILLAGRFGFFTQEPARCLPSGLYPIRETVEGGKTYVVGDGDQSLTVASRPTADPLTHMFLGFDLGIMGNGNGKQLFVRDVRGAFGRFLQRMAEVEKTEITIRWLGED